MADPLFETLFRSTVPPVPSEPSVPSVPPVPSVSTASEPEVVADVALLSAAPVRELGTRSRAGNAMGRTRAAVVLGARRAVQVSGTKITMAQVATASGIAKATLYNHFRTRDAVLAALLLDEVTLIVDGCAGMRLPDALAAAANAVAQNPTLARLAELEPAVVAGLGRIDTGAEGWRIARDAVEACLAADSRGGVDLVLRWLGSYLLSPANAEAIAADVALLLAALPDELATHASASLAG